MFSNAKKCRQITPQEPPNTHVSMLNSEHGIGGSKTKGPRRVFFTAPPPPPGAHQGRRKHGTVLRSDRKAKRI